MRNKSNIEGILPLTQQQSGMLLYCGEPGPNDLGFLQVGFDLVGELDPGAWRGAWDKVVQRHDALRMTIEMPPEKRPMAIVWKTVDLPWHFEDLQALDSAGQEGRLEAYRSGDRETGLALGEMPVMRVATFRLEAERHRVEWSCHHLLLDGWSSSIVLADCLAFYNAVQHGLQAPVRLETGYREYWRWLKERDASKSMAYWRSQFEAPLEPLLLVGDRGGLSPQTHQLAEVQLTESESASIRDFCTTEKVTVGALIRGLWASVLGAMTERSDVVYGAVVSGRAGEFPGVDALAGFFSNTIPVRLELSPQRTGFGVAAGTARSGNCVTNSTKGFRWSGFSADADLPAAPFDTLLLIENVPMAADAGERSALRMENYSSSVTSAYPLTLTVVPRTRWTITLNFDAEAIREGWATGCLDKIRALLAAIVAEPTAPMARLASAVGFEAPVAIGPANREPAVPSDKGYAAPAHPERTGACRGVAGDPAGAAHRHPRQLL